MAAIRHAKPGPKNESPWLLVCWSVGHGSWRRWRWPTTWPAWCGPRWRVGESIGVCRFLSDPRRGAEGREWQKMTIGRTNARCRGAQRPRSRFLFGSRSRNPSGPAVMVRTNRPNTRPLPHRRRPMRYALDLQDRPYMSSGAHGPDGHSAPVLRKPRRPTRRSAFRKWGDWGVSPVIRWLLLSG